jgi:hypothetical protein
MRAAEQRDKIVVVATKTADSTDASVTASAVATENRVFEALEKAVMSVDAQKKLGGTFMMDNQVAALHGEFAKTCQNDFSKNKFIFHGGLGPPLDANAVPNLIQRLRDLYIGFKMEGFGGDEDMSRLNMGSGFVKLSVAKWSKADQEEALKGEKEKMREMLEEKLEKVDLANIWNEKESSSRGRARSSRSRKNDAAEMDCARMGERSAVERAV